MKHSARTQACIDILEKLENSRVPMDSAMGDYLRVRRYIGSKDRADIAERVYNIMRGHSRLGWWRERIGLAEAPRTRVLLWLILGESAWTQKLHDLFDGSKYAPEPLNAEEEKAVLGLQNEKLDHPDMPEDIRNECPPEYYAHLKEIFGEAFEAEMKAMLETATLDIRVNTFLADREKVQNYLQADGVETAQTPYSPWGLRAKNKAFLSRTKAMGKGWIDIQDEGSQLIACICDVQPGMQVLDYCAGAGGKTLALAAAMNRKGRIVAMDNDARRLEKGRQRYKKAQLADIIEVRCLEEDKHRKWLRRQKEKFDVVLLDVPCSGTGTWRRNPDMRWRTYGPGLTELLEIQAEIMDRVVHVVKPGGRLVYATCSLLREENENQVEAFLKRHPEFHVKPFADILSEKDVMRDMGQSMRFFAGAQDDNVQYMRLTPHRHKTDGFFAAVLERR